MIIWVLLFSVLSIACSISLTKSLPILDVSPRWDTLPPIVSISSPKNSTAYSANNLVLDFTISAPTGPTINYTEIAEIHYSTDWQPKNITIYQNDPRSVNLTGIPEGKHNVTVYARYIGYYDYTRYSAYQNRFFIAGSSTVSFSIDTVPPEVSVLSLQNRTFTSDVPLDFDVNELVTQAAYSLDGEDNVTVAWGDTLSGLSYGLHNVTIYVWDVAGNIGASETATFTIAKETEPPAPFPTVPVAAASVASAAVVGAGLLVYFKKHKR